MSKKFLNNEERDAHFISCIAEIKNSRDSYRHGLKKIRKQYEKAEQNLRRNYQPSSPMLRSRLDELRRETNAKIVDLKENAKSGVLCELQSLIEHETQAVKHFSAQSALDAIESIGKLPLTQREFDVVVDLYAPTGFWAQKALLAIADKQGLIASEKLDCGFDTRISLLSQLSENFQNYIDNFESSNSEEGRRNGSYYQLVAGVSDSLLARCVPLFLHGQSQLESTQRSIDRIINSADNAPSKFEGAQRLRDGFAKLSPDGQTGLICRLAAMNVGDSSVLSMAGLSEMVESARRENLPSKYYKAQAAVSDLCEYTDSHQLARAIEPHKNDSLLLGMLKGQRGTNKIIADALKIAGFEDGDGKQEEATNNGEA